VTVSGNSSAQSPAATFQVGSGFTTTINTEGGGSSYAQLGINLTTTPGQFQVRDVTHNTNSGNFSGTQHITWAMNNSGLTLAYTAPNGTQESIGNDHMDVWVGTTKVFDDVAVTTTNQIISDLKFAFTNGNATITLDNFLANSITPLQDGVIFANE